MSAPTTAQPATTAFFGQGRVMRLFGAALRTTLDLAPRLGTALALRLFFTPLPLKFAAARRPVPPAWRTERWAFEGGDLVAYRRRHSVAPGAPTVLLVHGWAGHGLQMAALGDALAAAGFDPVLLDFPGHGRSRGLRSTLPQFARGIWAAAARLGPLHAIVAHSMGALASAHVAGAGLPVSRLALLSCSPPPSQVLRWFAHSFDLGASLPERMRQIIEKREPVPLDQFEADWLGPRLHQPTLLVHDQADRISPVSVGQHLAATIPGSHWCATQGLGHVRLLADPGVVKRVIDHVTTNGGNRPNQSAV
jgi:pimeloyl-ACP methyl ester carboxylesterase